MQNYLPACKIVSTHGVRGEMKALPLCDGADFLRGFRRLFTAPDGSGETELLGVRAQGNMLLVRLAGVEDMDAARARIGKTFYFAKADARLPEGRYFIDDLIGCTVLDDGDGHVLGTVTAVDHPGAQDIYTVRDAAGTDHLIPAVPEFIIGVDLQARTVTMRPIGGMFDEPVNGDEG
ncbi:MAG: ribosome maturation factor RimM [Gemmiger sp.]|uniref:ribosome maturation factor RimM n=1 Tax=Gemmiger sp. TaxID=2049027 RepID=UPI002E7722C1|nr:ribosome maturation factor RimM [Gemmiger sp.]MEE0800486.1 ribosome maturation factor RimM [Gemmiger sp.]